MSIKIRKRFKKSEYVIPLYPNKKAIEMGFNWLFAIIAGGFILFIAIFAAGRVITTGSSYGNTLTANNFVNIIETWEAGLATGLKPPELLFNTKTKLYFSCNEKDNLPFGMQRVSSSEVGMDKKYTGRGEAIAIKNKYIFTENQLEGKTFYPFSFGFYMPFKIADIIVFSDRNYCFYDAPARFKEELTQLKMNNIVFPNKTSECDGVKVCFSSGKECDISVSTQGKYVLKEGKKLYYEGNLLYAAIFSSPEIYNCNINRIVAKFNQLSSIYLEKIDVIEAKKCSSNVKNKLYQMKIMSDTFTSSGAGNIRNLFGLSDEIDSINNQADTGCKLYKNEEREEF